MTTKIFANLFIRVVGKSKLLIAHLCPIVLPPILEGVEVALSLLVNDAALGFFVTLHAEISNF